MTLQNRPLRLLLLAPVCLLWIGCSNNDSNDAASANYKGAGPSKAGAPSATPGGDPSGGQPKPSANGPKIQPKPAGAAPG